MGFVRQGSSGRAITPFAGSSAPFNLLLPKAKKRKMIIDKKRIVLVIFIIACQSLDFEFDNTIYLQIYEEKIASFLRFLHFILLAIPKDHNQHHFTKDLIW
jgi:hypothetical protein